MTRRIALIVGYDRTAYAGWQRQINAWPLAGVEERISRLAGRTTTVTGASRTDAGVHALAQTVHFDTDCHIWWKKFSYALNTMLPDDVRVRRIL